MARCPFAVWKPLPENAYQDPIDPDQVILHTAVDAEGRTSLFGYFGQEKITLESTFFVQMDGTIEQYLDTNVRADANFHVNHRAISIETEDDGRPDITPWTPAQVKSLIRLIDWICTVHPKVQRRRCPAWNQAGIGYHTMWGAPSEWTPVAGKTCPGAARIPQVPSIIAAVAGGTTIKEHPLMALTDDQQERLLKRVDRLWEAFFSGNPDGKSNNLASRIDVAYTILKNSLDDIVVAAVKEAVPQAQGVDPQVIANAVVAKVATKLAAS